VQRRHSAQFFCDLDVSPTVVLMLHLSFCNQRLFYGAGWLALCPTPNLEDQSFSVRVFFPKPLVKKPHRKAAGGQAGLSASGPLLPLLYFALPGLRHEEVYSWTWEDA